MLRRLIFAAALGITTTTLADEDAKMCGLGVSLVRDQADAARVLLDDIRKFLPGDVQDAAVKGDSVDRAITEIRKQLPTKVSGEVAELANSAVKILPLLQDFATRSEAAATVLEACAGPT